LIKGGSRIMLNYGICPMMYIDSFNTFVERLLHIKSEQEMRDECLLMK
jgi:hypothetical protein